MDENRIGRKALDQNRWDENRLDENRLDENWAHEYICMYIIVTYYTCRVVTRRPGTPFRPSAPFFFLQFPLHFPYIFHQFPLHFPVISLTFSIDKGERLCSTFVVIILRFKSLRLTKWPFRTSKVDLIAKDENLLKRMCTKNSFFSIVSFSFSIKLNYQNFTSKNDLIRKIMIKCLINHAV